MSIRMKAKVIRRDARRQFDLTNSRCLLHDQGESCCGCTGAARGADHYVVGAGRSGRDGRRRGSAAAPAATAAGRKQDEQRQRQEQQWERAAAPYACQKNRSERESCQEQPTGRMSLSGLKRRSRSCGSGHGNCGRTGRQSARSCNRGRTELAFCPGGKARAGK